MKLAVVQENGRNLSIRRMNTPYIADIKSSIGTWFIFLAFFGSFDLLSVTFNHWLRRMGSTPPNFFLTANELALLLAFAAFAGSMNLIPDFIGLLSPQEFNFDQDQNIFSVDSRKVAALDGLSIFLQDSFGPSRRAFRLVVTVRGTNYVIAQTQRITNATFFGKEYSYIVTSEGQQSKYWFNQWANYAGAKTGFSPEWPEYQEIFHLYAQLNAFVKASACIHD